MGMGTSYLFNFNRGRIGQFGIGTIWIFLPDRAANAAVRRFTGKEGKATAGGYSDVGIKESRSVATCTAT